MAKIFVSFTIVSTGNFFLVARENLNPLAEVYRSPVLTPPHAQRNVTIDGINPVVHRVELWSTLDNINLNQLRGRGDIDASMYTTIAFESFDFVVDRGFTGAPHYDPVSTPGSNTEYVNPDLANKTYLVFKPGFGPLLWDSHIEKRTDINGVDQGGFRYINGQEFAAGEEYTVMVSNLTTVQAGSSGSGYPDGVELISTSLDFSSTYYKKLIEVAASTSITLNIPDINTIPDNTVFGMNTHNLPNTVFKYAVLQLPLGKYCLINGAQRNKVYIGRAESVTFIKKGEYLRIVNWDGDYRRVGQRVYCDGIPPINSIPLLGGWFLKVDVIRLWEWYVSQLPAGEFITGVDDTDPGPNRQRWVIGDTKIWFPDHGGFFYRNKAVNNDIDPDGTVRIWNTLQADQNKLHNHTSPGAWNKFTARASDVGSYGTPSGSDSTNPSTEIRVTTITAGEFEDARIKDEGGVEARPKNIAAAIYVII